MDSEQVFLVPQLPPASGRVHHQQQQTTTCVVQQQSQPKCSICGTTQKLLRCAKCKAIYYCSTDHQHLDWPSHKQECRALAKQKQINNRLQQLTNSCGAININDHTKSTTCSSTETPNCSSNYSISCCENVHQPSLKSHSFVLGTHENEILNSKAETVAHNSNKSQYMGSFDANSTTTDQMHNIIIQNCLDPACVLSDRNQSYNDNSFYQSILTESDEDPINQTMHSQKEEQTQHNGHEAIQENIHQIISDQQQQTIYLPQQQTTLQYPVPQLSNHIINQREKSTSYQVGTAFGDESLFENANERRYEELCSNIISDMNQYGLSVVDDFLGREKGLQILNEVHKMYSAGVFKDGQLVNNMKSEQDLRTIRGDKIAWVKGVESGCSNVGYLINQIDAVICRANSMRNNGKLGNYVIKERTKAMVACYPGSGSHYVMHVDNPNKDGRVITAIYYLNLNWDSKNSGGVLRIFPEQTKSVADIEPKFDRLIFFWSDKRNPHEVQPAHRTRYAITVWYFDANERELALNRCKSSQSANTTNNFNNGSKSHAIENNTSNKFTKAEATQTSKNNLFASPTSCPAASTPSLQTTSATRQSLAKDNFKNPAATSDTIQNLRRPIQVVRPNSHK